ncbi:s1 RNA-binding domain-containing protein 1 [Caerostris extrusa]|uniref:S1 RNA-binding domain-containing protein 1 n=1 Tax=Caerostris extrusa TaxID=172846 RepID=A0AAV4XK54_CAEEX|nr:s1 RNA-binding domain-containing protein 1 [Caerostris extrusa]
MSLDDTVESSSALQIQIHIDVPQKRKRTKIVTIDNDDSDCAVFSSDDEYIPTPKKIKSEVNVKKKKPKPKKEPKPKVDRKKRTARRKKKTSLNSVIATENDDQKNLIDTPNKETKPKVVRKKPATSTARSIKKKSTLNSVVDIENDVQKDPIETLNTINGDEDEIPGSKQTKTDAELEKLVSQAVNKAKQFVQSWYDEEVVADSCQVQVQHAKNVISLLNQDCTIPFIVRYRRQMTGGMQAEKIRELQESYEEVKQVHKKVDMILKTIKHEKFDETIAASFLCAKSLDEVDLLYAPFKPGGKRTLAERSKQLGLEQLAMELFELKKSLNEINLQSLIKPVKGLQTEQEILSGLQHIISDKLSKDRKVLDFLTEKKRHPQIHILSAKSAIADKNDRRAFVEGKSTENFKYENYYQSNFQINTVAAHQIMALNRGEKQKVLTVKIQIPSSLKKEIISFIWTKFFSKTMDEKTYQFIKICVEDSYDRLIEPFLCRQIRSELSKNAEKESINVFGSNVRSLLLTPPVRGKTVIGIDPGFAHGCKVSCVSSKGEVLKTDVIYPHTRGKIHNSTADVGKLRAMISSIGAEIIAIGNGTACRETEVWLSNLIKSNAFHPFIVKYCIVNENGASIYSVTKEAEAELPDMDPNLRSAVSIARRLQDPLLEYVKIEPKHLGVGMYQHDVSEVQLKKTLDSIVEECVSFVGVDLNVCSEILLRKISGLTALRAKQIVEWRTKNSCFVNREQLLEVKGLGPKSYEQCAGFVKILPETCTSNVSPGTQDTRKKKTSFKINPLDRTIIHPESYAIAEKFLTELNVHPQNIGKQILVDKVNRYMKFTKVEDVASRYSVPVDVMQLIIDAFKHLQDYDIPKRELCKSFIKPSILVDNGSNLQKIDVMERKNLLPQKV